MKKLLLLSFVVTSFVLNAQDWDFEKPDYDKIEKNIKEKDSNLFYELLMKRYKEADSTMTLKEKRHLYYGYQFDEKYSPYSTSDFSDSLRVVLNKKSLDSLDYTNIVTFTNKILEENPFDLRAINYQLFALEKKGDTATFNKKVIQLYIIVDSLLSSGTGKSKEDSFYVLFTSHEYDLLSILGFKFGGSQSLIEHYDYLTLEKNEANIEGLYFDVSPCLASMSKMFKEK
ncbi:DUF4919 domain-containing protein [Tenacibaculum sp. 190524A05c]|uniref:DUF4919 domain-containing protein n=1 Tax=Tenacibaculum platacis TaxID=3137852 RepID=A0ABP1EVV5_9FLAO